MPLADLYLLAVLLLGLALLMGLTVRGKSIFVAAPLAAVVTAALSGQDPVATLTGPFAQGFADYIRNFYLVFTLGAAFGKLLDDSGAPAVVAQGIVRLLGQDRACLAVVLACAALTYGGVSLFVVGFSVYPLAVQLFRTAGLPRRFIPAALAFGSITFTMTSAGSPEIQNLIPIKYLVDAATGHPLTDARAGWPVSLIVALAMFLGGQLFLERALRRALAAGEKWEDREKDAPRPHDNGPSEALKAPARPHLLAAVAPLLVTLLALNFLPTASHWLARVWTPPPSLPAVVSIWSVLKNMPDEPALAIFMGVAAAIVVLPRARANAWTGLGEGFLNGLLAIGSTASVVGFGAAVKGLPAFQQIVTWVTQIPGDPLLSAAIAVAVIAAIAGSASGGQGIALPILKPIYVDQWGVAPRALHRVVAISSGSLDSLPANGYIVMLIRTICGETHERAYGPLFVTTVVIPTLGAALAIGLFKLFPSLGTM